MFNKSKYFITMKIDRFVKTYTFLGQTNDLENQDK